MPLLRRLALFFALIAVATAVLVSFVEEEVELGVDPGSAAFDQPFSALVLGPTGAVGRELVRQLADTHSCTRVGLVVRDAPEWRLESASDATARVRAVWNLTDVQAAKLTIIPVRLDTLDTDEGRREYASKFAGYQKGFSALGTTRRKAGSESAFRAIDYTATLAAAVLMREGGVTDFSLVSSVGADINATFLYPQTKGEIEHAVSRIGFDRVSIHRPGLLLTDRPSTDSRPFEAAMQVLVSRLHGVMSLIGGEGAEHWKAISVRTVAAFVLQAAAAPPNTRHGQVQEYTHKEVARIVPYVNAASLAPVVTGDAEAGAPAAVRTFVEVFENEVMRSRRLD